MPKPRSKRSQLREEKKAKRKAVDQEVNEPKRRRKDDDGDIELYDEPLNGDENNKTSSSGRNYHEGDHGEHVRHNAEPAETEFFGMLAEEEQEYFRRSDELLEINDFPSADDRKLFVNNLYAEAKGKELKLASSQSCSRLMEKMIQLADTAQKKSLFQAFAGHFMSLVRHRFASHCCEALFLKSAGVVTQELSKGFEPFVVDTEGAKGTGEENAPEASMEELFLATLDELEEHLSYLLTDRFASHTLRVLLLVLSGRPLDDATARTLMKSKKKEKISVVGAAEADEMNKGTRTVPGSFGMAIQKIVEDSLASVDATSLRVLAKHPIGNPTLQLLLELDLTLNKGDAKADKAEKTESSKASLLQQLLPGAPQSLGDETSEASEFINGMIYDSIGSRIVETLTTHAPGRVFKALNQNIFLPRIQGYVRNDTSCYSAIRVINRLGKDDLVTAVDKIAPTVAQLVEKKRFNVLKALFERCSVRSLNDEIKKLMKGLREGCGKEPANLIKTLCLVEEKNSEEAEDGEEDGEEKKKKKKTKKADVSDIVRNEYAIQSHGSQLLTTLLTIPGPSKGIQESLTSLSPELLLTLATTSVPTVTILTAALSTLTPNNPAFHKVLINTLTPHAVDLALSQPGHNFVNAIVEVPSKGKERSVPFHMKEALIQKLAAREADLRQSWTGRSVWRTWKGDMWKTRRHDWKVWMREVDAQAAAATKAPVISESSANAVKIGKGAASRPDRRGGKVPTKGKSDDGGEK